MLKSLKATNNQLSDPAEQVNFLENGLFGEGKLPRFSLKTDELSPLAPEVFQMNLGYMCNQTCKHCHVDAGPDRKEIMSKDIMKHCLEVIKINKIKSVDLTGGAPEMNPNFVWLVKELRTIDTLEEIIVRSNLTILVSNARYKKLPNFFAENNIRVVSSLPFYNADKTDRQRGVGVFKRSIEALQMLNEVGYGKTPNLIIDLVYNPSGAFLPGEQFSLERDFKLELKKHYQIEFNNLLTITNLPISRFLEFLVRTENYEEYMETLVTAYNPETVENLMCKNTLSVGWDGFLYDCDFNQMLDLKVEAKNKHISSFNLEDLMSRKIVTGQHCYGCTAGAGSSCQGSLI